MGLNVLREIHGLNVTFGRRNKTCFTNKSLFLHYCSHVIIKKLRPKRRTLIQKNPDF